MPAETPDPRPLARIAGLLYLAIIVLGLTAELGVRAALVVPGDAAATASAILGSPGLFRLGIAADAVMAVCDVALAVLLYVLLRPAGPVLALMATAFRLIQTAIIGANLLNQNAALLLLEGHVPGGPDPAEMGALASVALSNHSHGYDLGLLFFGVNCLLLGVLFWRSGYFPKALGPLVGAAGLVYVTGTAIRFLAPGLGDDFAPAYALPLVAELAICLWLLVRGVDRARWTARAVHA